MADAKKVLDAASGREGWNERTQITLLCDFIDEMAKGPFPLVHSLTSYLDMRAGIAKVMQDKLFDY